ncbi:vegetative cell wall protein gp1-like [Mesocricetus auratus]|uniref:Vegetative cell wall protein gp1-like n=1 Tax=Mesocricetus auratus TaxID=10036 RepID=A0ABM2XDC0_MESAU|nr:vegetative cell wall protein gp1-like [Mesocricetus auratus]
MTCHCFSDSSMASGQFRIKVVLKAVTRGARRGCGRGSPHRRAGGGPPAPTTPARAPTEGKGAREGRPPRASRDRRGLCQAGLFRAPSAPRDCPGLAQAVLGPAAGDREVPGHRARAEDSRPPSPGLPHPRCPDPRRPGPRRSSKVVLLPSSPSPAAPYLAPGPGASGGGGRGRRPALLPRFRRSQELNIPPLRAAPMRKTSRQQHHLPPGAEPPAALPPGTPGHTPSGKAGARGHTDPGCCMPPRDLMLWLGRGQQGSRFLWSQGCRCLGWNHQQIGPRGPE